jgi:hypothetical protein
MKRGFLGRVWRAFRVTLSLVYELAGASLECCDLFFCQQAALQQ